MLSTQCRIIFVSGGVLSSLGKGVIAASLGLLLEQEDLNVSILKIDPYLNVDAGTMSPFEHGEVFVTDDGAESDLDLGTYERFLNRNLSKTNHVTAGKIFLSVLEKERKGDYLGSTVQIIPHITNQIKNFILHQDPLLDVLLVEIGGTVGDIESLPFLEAVRQLMFEWPHTLSVHVTLVPYMGSSGEIKTKPTQHSVRELRSIGIIPDVIVCRTAVRMNEQEKAKIALFSNLPAEAIFESPDLKSIYELPALLKEQGCVDYILKACGFESKNKPLGLLEWNNFVSKLETTLLRFPIVVVGKYAEMTDAYKSLKEALLHAGLALGYMIDIEYIDAEHLEQNHPEAVAKLHQAYGILVPGGFGSRGVEGKMLAAQYARMNKIPYFGICLGMQLALIEIARHCLNKKAATSEEFDEQGEEKIFCRLQTWLDEHAHVLRHNHGDQKGGTLRVGSYLCHLQENSLAHKIYGSLEIQERHRHRFEFNNHYRAQMEDIGVVFSGEGASKLVDIIELKDHPWFIGTQFHPEFLSKPIKPHPLFKSFIEAAVNYKKHLSS